MDFSEIYRRYAPHVHRFSIYLSGNPARAEDLAAETFVHALCGRTSLRVDTVKAYLFGIARNLYRDLIERQRRLVPKSKFESTCRGQVKVFSFFSCHWPYVCHPDVPLPAMDTSNRVERGGSHGAIECATSPRASG